MANTTISPNMKLPVPTVGTDPGPDWADNLNASLNAIDSHNHSSEQGVQINSDGININTDFPVNENNVTMVRSVNFDAQLAPLALATDVGCIYVSGQDLYYNDESGNQVRITQGGSVAGATGTITGLPSGTASASFAGATFTFQSATNTPATISGGPIIISRNAASPKTVTVSANASQAANYAMTLPLALPGSTSIMNVDSSGQQGLVAPDNLSFGVSGGTYQVLDGGVTNTKLASANYSSGNIPTAYTLVSTSFVAITDLTTSLTCAGGSGRPVFVFLTTSTTGQQSYIQYDDTPSAGVIIMTLQIIRNSDVIGETVVSFIPNNGLTILTIPAWTVIDNNPPAGSNTYLVKGKTDSAFPVSFQKCGLIAMEF